MYKPYKKIKAKKIFIWNTIFYLVAFLSAVTINLFGQVIPIVRDKVFHFYDMQSIFVLLISIFTFVVFLNIQMKPNKIINFIGSTTFGIYLIHDNRIIRNILWSNIFNVSDVYNKSYLILYCIFSILIIFVICSIIDALRSKTIEIIYRQFIDWIINKFENLKRKVSNITLFKKC